MSLQVMMDIETYGTAPNSCVVIIGAYCFDTKKPLEGKHFYERIKPESAVRAGLMMDQDTVDWWSKQTPEARAEMDRATVEGGELVDVLGHFSDWYKALLQENDLKKIPVWGNGATFDNVLVACAYRVLDKKLPWNYRADRCYRTLSALWPNVPFERVGVYHNALDDCKSQALHLSKLYEAAGLG